MKKVKVKQLLLPNEIVTASNETAVREIILQAKKQQTQVVMAKAGLTWKYKRDANVSWLYNFYSSKLNNDKSSNSSDITLRILDTPLEPVSGNEASTLVGVYAGKSSLLLTGDMGLQREEQLQLKPHTILKAGHHGSKYSSSMSFLEQVQPQYTVISCGLRNRYGHPHSETLERFACMGTKVLRTDERGAIKIVFER